MGELVKCKCKCGYKTKDLLIGVGFNSFENGQEYRMAYCEHCENVQSVSSEDESPRCEKCKHLMTYYEGALYQVSNTDSVNLTQTSHYCPRCKTNSLQFIWSGLWD